MGTCPNCSDASPTYLHAECEAEYMAYITGQPNLLPPTAAKA